MKIKFTNVEKVSDAYLPKPSSDFIPSWYKDTKSYYPHGIKEVNDGKPNFTIKKCMPVFDALTAGYIITTYTDVWVTHGPKEGTIFNWSSFKPIQFHPNFQADKHPLSKEVNGESFPKWINAWGIETPKGYSCLFINPMHNPNGIFTILEGIVDTDQYTAAVSFPFVMNDIHFEGLIPAGTPIAQVIPFKRESWKMEFGNEKDIEKQQKLSEKMISRFFDKYKTFAWIKKEYK